MIILPNRNDKYIDEMNNLVFSDDIKDKIISNILKKKQKNRKIYIAMTVLMISLLCITVINFINTPKEMNSNFLYEEDIENINYVNSIKDIIIDTDNNIDNLEISPNQMVILSISNIQDNIDSINLQGRLTGNNRAYSFGYIVDKSYTEILSHCTEEYINNQIDVENGTEYSLCIINYSENILTFSGNILMNPKDLVYYDYVGETLQIEKNSIIKIDLSDFYNSYDIDSIYVYNCITHQTVKFPFADSIEYENKQDGVYLIFATTIDGEKIDLSKNVTIEYSINEETDVIGL